DCSRRRPGWSPARQSIIRSEDRSRAQGSMYGIEHATSQGRARRSFIVLQTQALKLLALLLLFAPLMTYAGLLTPQSMPSKYLGTNRTVRIYLPPSYFKQPSRRYSVLYLHDGQN